MNKCKIPDCNCLVAAVTKHNLRFSKNYCEKHSTDGVLVKCKICGAEFYKRASQYDPDVKYECLHCVRVRTAISGANNRITKMKENGSYENWQKSCHSRESRVSAYATMVENGTVNNLIAASNTPEIIRKKQQSRITSGAFDRFMEASRKKNKELWDTDLEYRKQKLKQIHAMPNFIIKNNIFYYYDKQLDDYVPWTDYKTQFKTFNIDWQLPDGFQIIPTFRSQDSDSWNGAKAAFEQSLVDLNIGWFVYIKFYISADNQILPLVIGKSGSLLVNSSGSDLSFSTALDDGPARCFLAEEGLKWCKTQISILACNSEQEAYKQECRLATDYNLFES